MRIWQSVLRPVFMVVGMIMLAPFLILAAVCWLILWPVWWLIRRPVRSMIAANQQITEAHRAEDAHIVCPHCGEHCVTTKATTRERGVSGGKAAGAVFTLGVSMLATGLSRTEKVTKLHCSNCGMTWVTPR